MNDPFHRNFGRVSSFDGSFLLRLGYLFSKIEPWVETNSYHNHDSFKPRPLTQFRRIICLPLSFLGALKHWISKISTNQNTLHCDWLKVWTASDAPKNLQS